MKLTGIVSSHCDVHSVGIQTDPPITEEIFEEAKNGVGPESTLQIDFTDGVFVVRGNVWPPREEMFKNTEILLSDAYAAVEERKQREEASHRSIVDHYSKAAGVPVID